MKIAICDDDESFCKIIKEYVQNYFNKNKTDCAITCYASGEELLVETEGSFDYDIVFLDISMQDINGIDTARHIRHLSEKAYIVFVTGYIDYALVGYEVNAIRYILKSAADIDKLIHECLDAIMKNMGRDRKPYSFDFQSGKKEITLDKILYIESRLHNVIFYIQENGVKEYSLRGKLDDVYMQLQDKGFCRTHQSFIVNLHHVKAICRYEVLLDNGMRAAISKRYYKDVQAKYLRYKGEM